MEKELVSELFDRLRARLREPEPLRLLDAVEEACWKAEGEFREKLKTNQEEISVLRDLTGVTTDDLKLLFARREREFLRVKREAEEGRARIRDLLSEREILQRENDRLQRENEWMTRRTAQARVQWEGTVQDVEKQKKILNDEMHKMVSEMQALWGRLEEAERSLREQEQKDRSLSGGFLTDQMQEWLGGQRRQILESHRTLFQGLSTFLKNYLGGVVGSTLMVVERTASAKSAEQLEGSFLKVLFTLPFRYRKIRQANQELHSFRDVLMMNSESLEMVQKGLSDFSLLVQPAEANPEKRFLSDFMEKLIEEQEAVFKRGRIDVRTDWGRVPPVRIDDAMFRSAVMELITNAMEALPQGGELVFSLWEEAENALVVLSVADRGQGVPQQFAEKVFHPFFTTKAGHAGLGLTRAYWWMALNGGGVELRQESMGGEFLIKLPAVVDPGGVS